MKESEINLKRFNYIKIIYFVCSIPVFVYILSGVISAFSFRHTTLGFNLVYMLVSLFMVALLYLWWLLNYNFINTAYQKKYKEAEIVVVLSCLAVGAFILVEDFIEWFLLLTIGSMILNVCIRYINKRREN